MALVVADRVLETTTTTGTGTVTLAGAATGYQSFAVIGNGNTTYYTIADQSGSNWEVGIGTYTSSGTTLSRDTVLASSNSNALVNFGAGTKNVFVTYPAGRSVTTTGVETLTNKTLDAGTVVTDNSTGNALRITQTGTGNALLVEDSANPDSTPFVVNSAGQVIVGNTSLYGSVNTYSIELHRNASGSGGLGMYSWSTTAAYDDAIIFWHYPSGTIGTKANNTAGDGIGRIVFRTEYDNGSSTISNEASIRAIVSSIVADTALVYLRFIADYHQFTGNVRFTASNGTNYIALSAGSATTDTTYTLPAADGTSGQVLSTNGSGTLSWATVSSGGISLAEARKVTSLRL